jgi:hypothetical protein
MAGSVTTHWNQQRNMNIVPRLDSGVLPMGTVTGYPWRISIKTETR